MKKGFPRISILLSIVAMLILIFDPVTSFAGASQGMDLCIRTVIPSLFPFFILSSKLNSVLSTCNLSVLRPLGKLCSIPAGQEPLFLVGILSGYPVGAQNIYQSYANGLLTRQNAHRMLGFCCNAGPSFIFGITSILFKNGIVPWILWGIQILSSILVGIVLPDKDTKSSKTTVSCKITLSEALLASINALANVCGWVIFFRVAIKFLECWLFQYFPITIKAILAGILELTNGCTMLNMVSEETNRFIMCSGFLSFGGLCVIMQTRSVTKDLGTGYYIKGKIVQCLISVLCAHILHPFLFPYPVNVIIYIQIIIIGLIIIYLSIFIIMQKKM